MAEAEYKILMTRRDDFDTVDDAAKELSADVTEHIRDGWSLHGSLSVTNNNHGSLMTFTQALFKPSGTTPGGTKPVATKRQRE